MSSHSSHLHASASLGWGIKWWWEHKLIPPWRRTFGGWGKRFFECSCHNFLWHGRCCRLGRADEHIAVRFTPFWSRSPGEIPHREEIHWPRNVQHAKSVQDDFWQQRRWLQRQLRDFYHLACLFVEWAICEHVTFEEMWKTPRRNILILCKINFVRCRLRKLKILFFVRSRRKFNYFPSRFIASRAQNNKFIESFYLPSEFERQLLSDAINLKACEEGNFAELW